MTSQAFMEAVSALNEQEKWHRTLAAPQPAQAVLDAHNAVVGQPAIPPFVEEAHSFILEATQGIPTPAVEAPVAAVSRESAAINDLMSNAAGYGVAGALSQEELHKIERSVGGVLGLEVPQIDPKVLAIAGVVPDFDWLEKAEAVMRDAAHFPIPDVASEAANRVIEQNFGLGPVVVREPPPARVFVPPASPAPKPSDLAGITAQEEAESNLVVAEELLREEGLHYELEHLDAISVCLTSGTEIGRVHAAMSASLLFKGTANALFPAQETPWVDRSGNSHPVGAQHVGNRIAAFIGAHLGTELSKYEHRRLQTMLEFSYNWSQKGHHKPFPIDQANRAYRDLLAVFAYLSRARRASIR
jgi:hypothetical protein